MKFDLDIRDLVIRVLVIAVTSIILLFVTHNNNFDLHFKIRKPQVTTPEIFIVEVPNSANTDESIVKLMNQKPKALFISHYFYETPREGVVNYAINEDESRLVNFNAQPDPDGLIRRVSTTGQLNYAFKELSNIKNQVINFRGPKGTFATLSLLDLRKNESQLEDKIIVYRTEDESESYTSPVGLLHESELIANILDNAILGRFLPPKNFYLALFIVFLLLAITVAFLIYLPSTLALISSIAIAITYLSFSLWIFDNYYLWTPILTPIIQMFLTFLLISNYKFVLNEKTRWSLQKESLYADQLEEMKTNFLSLFSHDLKTPLAKIIGISDTLGTKIKDPEIRLELEKINQASKDLEKYIKRILKMSQVQSKNIALNKSPEDLNNLIEKSIEQNRFAANEKNITVEQELAPLFMVDMDGALVQEVIINFIENAVRYSPENSRIIVKSEEINNYLKMTVKDEGKGIPKEAQDNIWEKYYRFDSDKSGYGLGLFLSRYVIHLHGGQVFLNSKENIGSEFGFLLPIDEE